MMKMNRKALVLLASVMLAASTAGCGNTAENNGPAVEALAPVPETGTEEETPDSTTAAPNEETEGPEEKTGAATAEPATAEEETSVATAAPDAEPAATPEPAPASAATPAPAPAATPEPAPAATPEPAATPAPESPGGDLVLVPDAPATAGVVEKTETVTTQPASHSRPEGMPEVVYSEEEMIMAMLLYGGVGDGYRDNGDGTWTYYYNGYEDNTSGAATTTVTTDNWYKGSEADVVAKLAELQAVYPNGSHWGEDTVYDNPGSTIDSYITNNDACAGYAKLVSDYCFGYDAPVRHAWIYYSELRPGDIILQPNHASVFTGGDWHESSVTSDLGPMLTFNITDANAPINNDSQVRWIETYFTLSPELGQDGYFEVLTRYPE